jgi:2OG-Fe(II) oxygenase superfamily
MAAERVRASGPAVLCDFLEPGECDALLAGIDDYRQHHDLPVVSRPHAERPLNYQVIDGHHFPDAVPDADALLARVHQQVETMFGAPLVLIDDTRAACNVNVTPPGGAYRWHYDRNRVTALLYLNQVAGGETDLYPNYRLVVPAGMRLQPSVDRILMTRPARRLLGRVYPIAPAPGTLAIIRGDRTLHSVRPVAGDQVRINLVLAYDRPGATHQQAALNQYLYDPARPVLPADRPGQSP